MSLCNAVSTRVFLLTYLTYAVVYVTRKEFSLAKQSIQLETNIGTYKLSYIDTAFLSTYALFQIIIPIFGDLYGVRYILIVALIISGFGSIAFAFSNGTLWFIFFWFIEGLAHSPIFSVLLKAVAFWFSGHDKSIMLGIWTTSQQAGAIFATTLITFISSRYSWRVAFAFAGFLTLCNAVLIYFFLPEPPIIDSDEFDISVELAQKDDSTQDKISDDPEIIYFATCKDSYTEKVDYENKIINDDKNRENNINSQNKYSKKDEMYYDKNSNDIESSITYSESNMDNSSTSKLTIDQISELSISNIENSSTPTHLKHINKLNFDLQLSKDHDQQKMVHNAFVNNNLSVIEAYNSTQEHAPLGYSSLIANSIQNETIYFSDGDEHKSVSKNNIKKNSTVYYQQKKIINTEKVSCSRKFRETICLPGLLYCGAAYFFVKFVRYVLLFWLPFFLGVERELSLFLTAIIAVLFDIGGVVGSIATGFLMKYFKQVKFTTLVFMCLIASNFLYSFARIHNLLKNWIIDAIYFFFIGAFIAGPDSILGASAAMSIWEHQYGKKYNTNFSTATGIINGIGAVGSIFQSYITAFITHHFGWQVLFFLLSFSCTLSAILLLPVCLIEYNHQTV